MANVVPIKQTFTFIVPAEAVRWNRKQGLTEATTLAFRPNRWPVFFSITSPKTGATLKFELARRFNDGALYKAERGISVFVRNA